MSDGGNFSHTVQSRDEASFKSAEQIAREAAQNDLVAWLQSTGQVGRMPTRAALETAGQGALAKALVASFGGLHSAADAMGLSKRLLNEEAEARKVAKREAAQQLAAEQEELRRAAPEPLEPAPAHEQAAAGGGAGGGAGGDDDDDLPPGVGPAPPRAAAPAKAASVPPPPPPPAGDPRWQYDPNVGLFFQLSTQCYFDNVKSLYAKGGRWSREKPA